MSKSPVTLRFSKNQIAKHVAIVAFGVGAAYGCAVSEGDLNDGPDVSLEGVDGVAPADGPIGTVAPTVTVVPTTLPPIDVVYHGTIDLHPGTNSNVSVSDSQKRSPYRVLIKDTLGYDGDIDVSLLMDGSPSVLGCSQYKLDYTVEGFSSTTDKWVTLGTRTKTGVYSSGGGGGEFPAPPSCNLTSNFDVDSTAYTKLRVSAKGQRTLSSGSVVVQNMRVSTAGINPIPPAPWRLDITNLTLEHTSTTTVRSAVKNLGPGSAPGGRATLGGYYKYCPPAQPGESHYCKNNGEQTEGFFANPNVNPGGNPVFPHRNAKTCQITPRTISFAVTIAAGSTHNSEWNGPLTSNDSGCQPCTPGDGRCYQPVIKVETDSTAADEQWETWDEDTRTLTVPGVQ